jgi:hypothetical protein
MDEIVPLRPTSLIKADLPPAPPSAADTRHAKLTPASGGAAQASGDAAQIRSPSPQCLNRRDSDGQRTLISGML